MAIQFNCPYCTATIRVADEFAGKQGRCPKCETRLLVPVVQRPSASHPAAGSAADQMSLADTAAGVRTVADQTSVGMHALESVPGGVPEFAPVVPSTTVTTRLKRRTRRSRRNHVLVVGIPVVCFLILMGILGVVMTSSLPDLEGTLTATRQGAPTVPTQVFPWSITGLTPDDRQQLQDALTTSPDGFASELMTCRFVAGEKGLEVQLRATEGNAWFVVDPLQSKPLLLWLQKHQQVLNVVRAREMQTQMASYCREKLLIAAGEHLQLNAQTYRDAIGLNTHTRALGYALEAIAGSRSVRCAHEDPQGRLYFLLPEDTSSFQVKGRRIADGSVPFPGDYQVTVESPGPDAVLTTSPSEPSDEMDDPAEEADSMDQTTDVPTDAAADPEAMNSDNMDAESMTPNGR